MSFELFTGREPPGEAIFITLTMPIDESHRYFVRGAFQSRTVSRMSRSSYPYAQNSSRFQPTPYPSTRSMMTQSDADGHDWFQDTGDNLHLSDFDV
jgi:hypothetical protein